MMAKTIQVFANNFAIHISEVVSYDAFIFFLYAFSPAELYTNPKEVHTVQK